MTKYLNKLVEYYTSFKNNNKKFFDDDLPKSVIDIYSPENDCFKTIGLSDFKHFGVSQYDMIEFFIYSCNNNKFKTKDDITKFYNFITKNISDSKILEDTLMSKLCSGGLFKKNDLKLFDFFVCALFEQTPNEILSNDLLRKIITAIGLKIDIGLKMDKENINYFNYIAFVNKRGLEFDAKTLKLLKTINYDMSSIVSKDSNVNIQKYNSICVIDNICKGNFEESKKVFYDSLKENNINSENVNLVFIEINKMMETLFEYKYIENLIKIKMHYEINLNEYDIYLLGQYSLTEKINDVNLTKEIKAHFTERQYILDFDNTTFVKYFKKPQTVRDPEDRYRCIKDVRYNFKEILENIVALGFNVKKYNQNEIKNMFELFSKYADEFLYNVESKKTKLNRDINYIYGEDKEDKRKVIEQQLKTKSELKTSFLESVKSYDIFDKIYEGEYNKEYIKMILMNYYYVFNDMLHTKPELINLIDNDIISILFALNYGDEITYLYNNKIFMQNEMTEYILYTRNINEFLETIYKINIRLTDVAYTQLSSLIPKTIAKTLDLKKYILNDDIKPVETLSEKLNKMDICEQIQYVQQNYKSMNINDILNMKDNNGKTYILNYISKQNIQSNKIDKIDKVKNPEKVFEKPKKVIKKTVNTEPINT